MVGPGALKPKVGDGIKSRRPLSAPVLILLFFFLFCVCCCTSIGVYIIIIIIWSLFRYVLSKNSLC